MATQPHDRRLVDVRVDTRSDAARRRSAGVASTQEPPDSDDRAAAVAALYRDHAVSLIRLAHIMLGSRAAAEDVVQDAFCGLYRRWGRLADRDRALGYLRSSVLNGCRTALRRNRPAWVLTEGNDPRPVTSAETAALSAEERREVARALRSLPNRQREVLVLTYYFDLSDNQISQETGIGLTSIRSARHRGLAALGRVLRESP